MPQETILLLPHSRNPEEIPGEEIRLFAARNAKVPVDEIREVRWKRVSFDGRRGKMKWRVVLDLWMHDEPEPPALISEPPTYRPLSADAPRAIVIGSGPSGLFCALSLIEKGVRPIVFERGPDVQGRRRDIALLNRGEAVNPESNYCFGAGGAGTFSDGKLYARSTKRGDVGSVLETLVAHGAPDRILWAWRPHIGSNKLPKVVEAMVESIRDAGGEVHYDTRVDEILTSDNAATGVRLASGDTVEADSIILATGHSALSSLKMAKAAGATLEPKGFAMGVRIEYPQEWLDERQYRGVEDHSVLPPAFFELSTQVDERGVYSFCMCPGGWIVPCQTEPNSLVMNGMSLSKRDSPFANSALVVSIEPRDWCGKRGWRWGWPEVLKKAAAISDHPMLHEVIDNPGGVPIVVAEGRLPVHTEIDPLFGVRLQIALEALAAHAGGGDNKAPAQRSCDFIEDESELEPIETSYLPGLTQADFNDVLPRGVHRRLRQGLESLDKQLRGLNSEFGQVIGVETRTSSPVRIFRDKDTLQSVGCANLYPCAEGSGYAGGIISAALDGLRVAEQISKRAL